MRLGPNPTGGRGEEARKPHVCCALAPRPPTAFDRSPVQQKPKRPTPQGALPAKDIGSAPGSGGGGGASLGAQAAAVEHPQLLATESDRTGVNEQAEDESLSAPSGACLPAPPAKTGSQQRRTRTLFTLEQLQKLEQIFQKQNYLTVPERRHVAALLGLAEEQVRNWFQNRRMKFKREHQDQWQSFLPSVPFSSYNSGVPSNFFQDFSMYPQQVAPPYLPNSGLQSSSPCPLYQPPLNPPYPFLAPGPPYHFPPQLLMHPVTQYEADCMPSPHFAE